MQEVTLCHVWEAARQLVAPMRVLGWSHSDNPQGLVAPFFLVLLSGKTPGALPANLAQLWQAGLQNSVGFDYWVAEGKEENRTLKRLERAYTERLAQAALSGGERDEILAWCTSVAKKRVDAIVGGKHRGSYDKAAMLISACAETLQLAGKSKEADALLDDIRHQFPRHRAFQSELEMAMERMGRAGAKRK